MHLVRRGLALGGQVARHLSAVGDPDTDKVAD